MCGGGRDHPRVCGEHRCTSLPHSRLGGSSPRMRGTHCCRRWDCPRPGIIPAYAGNTSPMKSRVRPRRDHPRVCGEHDMMVIGSLEDLGSSPRMRGTQNSTRSSRPTSGIIPAYAGNTVRRAGHSYGRRGSSPRMRGTPDTVHQSAIELGIIPAYAGNTWRCLQYDIQPRDHPRVCGEHTKRL